MKVSYVLKSNFGWIENREHRFLPKGTALIPGKDDAIISRVCASGAALEEVEVKEESATETPPEPAKKDDEKAKGKK